jgi:NAD(P)-dependent dehydrogenase (short-subunit alcohol dehydrogenase family)
VRVLVTGGNAGIGFETCRALARMGHDVVLGARDAKKGDAARDLIQKEHPSARVETLPLDLADLANVRRAAAEIRARHERLDALILNAGFHTARFERTKDGFETTFGVNHLAHFELTRLLLPTMSPRARVVTVASEAHRGARVDWSDLQLERSWSGLRAYANSKLFNVWFARELARRHPEIASFAVHPGSVRSGWARGGESGLLRVGVVLASPFLISAEKGARTSVYAATSPELEGKSGLYLVREKAAVPSRLARDDAQAARLWEASESLLAAHPPKR